MKNVLYRTGLVVWIVALFVIIGIFPVVSGYYSEVSEIEKIDVKDFDDLTVTITKPKKGYYYKNDIEMRENLFDKERPHILGPITVKASVNGGENGTDRVEFYINDRLNFTDDTSPYEWLWDYKLAVGENIVKVRAYDNDSHTAEDSITVLVLMIKDEASSRENAPIGLEQFTSLNLKRGIYYFILFKFMDRFGTKLHCIQHQLS